MSKPERLCLDGPTGVPEELVVTVYDEAMDTPRAVAVPRERDLAEALSRSSNEWFERFLRAFQKSSPNRAMVVARVAESAQLKPESDHEKAFSDLAAAFGVSQEDLVGAVLGAGWQLLPAARAVLALSTDVTGGDCDPGFGVDPGDSQQLLLLRQAIDAIGWNNQDDEERGDYLGRLKEIQEELPALAVRATKLENKVRTQRIELRRFNREARERNEAAQLFARVTKQEHESSKHSMQQALFALRQWLKDHP